MSDIPEILMIPVNAITVLNPRARNKRVFQELVTSIERLGLKKPITVSQRPGRSRYDLVCGQGRLEAFMALGQESIPAVVIDAAEDDCFVMSLVENLARRQHTPLELVRAIGALRERGYSHGEIAAKVGFSREYIYAICFLLENGEEKLISAVERGVIPHTIAMGRSLGANRRLRVAAQIGRHRPRLRLADAGRQLRRRRLRDGSQIRVAGADRRVALPKTPAFDRFGVSEGETADVEGQSPAVLSR